MSTLHLKPVMTPSRDASRHRKPSFEQVALFRRELMEWYRQNRRDFPWRRVSASDYVKVVSEVLLKRTRAEAVAGFLPAFLRTYPSWNALAMASEHMLEHHLKPLGLAPTRSRSLRALACEVTSRGGSFPSFRDELEKLPAVGQYVASAILLFCFGQREPLLDNNMARVLERFFGPRKLRDIRFDPFLQNLSKTVVDTDDPVSINWAMLDFGALICKKSNPQCGACRLVSYCLYATSQNDRASSANKT